MTYADMFSKVKGMMMEADVSTVNEHLAYQFNITGEAEGIFYAEVKEGKLYVEPYEYYDRDAIFTCSAETLFKINEGKLDPVLAVTLGKLKVEGNIDKALYLKKLIDSRKDDALRKTSCTCRPGGNRISRGRWKCILLQKNNDAL